MVFTVKDFLTSGLGGMKSVFLPQFRRDQEHNLVGFILLHKYNLKIIRLLFTIMLEYLSGMILNFLYFIVNFSSYGFC
jgi:hypothetical protein